MSRVTVYTTDPCSFCVRVKALLKSRNVEFDEVNLAKDAPAASSSLAAPG
jgi:glutaredoxin 3